MPDQNDIIFNQNSIDLLAIFKAIFSALGMDDITFVGFVDKLAFAWDVFFVLSLIVGAALFYGFIYASIRFNQLADIEAEGIKKMEDLYQELYGTGVVNSRFQDVEQHIQSDNPNDWKLAIIEADIILDSILDKVGYAGSTIGEKLKSASPQSFVTLDDAWRAHKIRNQIAHSGSDFILTKKLAQETITQYKRVFTEFGEA